ncbi:MAG: SAM-dependent methyltransferase [Bacteroidetes bacterium]|nr:SAM-dependent methyltransferase [Bacteroidota bacterium]MBI3481661.1 SAM-dependent methyltransferase [Bacteroidota bacterium]
MENKGKLFLIPTVIAEDATDTIPSSVLESLKLIDHFLVEEARTARRFLSSLKIYESIEALQFSVLNKDTEEADLAEMFAPIFSGKNVGVLSESGCPGIADPGALAVNFAHQKNIQVVPLVGPSSILLALIASGLNGQQFAFHGYLPIDSKEASQKIKTLAKESLHKNLTQIFIETPYRNNQMLKHLIDSLPSSAQLCIALDLTGKNEFVKTKTINEWKKNVPSLPKEPAVFLFQA